jgi:hypothetical protein
MAPDGQGGAFIASTDFRNSKQNNWWNNIKGKKLWKQKKLDLIFFY